MQTATHRTGKNNSPRIKKPLIGIIGGTSQFGQWFKLFFRRCGYRCLISGRKTALTPLALAKKADIVIVSVPIRETVKVIRAIRTHVKPGALLCDFTSLKTESLAEMMKCDKRVGVLGIHPLFGPLVPSLRGQNIVFTPGRNNARVIFLKNLFKKNGGKVIKMPAAEHDRQMAAIQALTHFMNIAYAGTLRGLKNKPKDTLSTPVFRSQSLVAARILGGDPPLYADIEIHNKYFKKVLAQFIAKTKQLEKIVINKNEAAFEKNFRSLASLFIK